MSDAKTYLAKGKHLYSMGMTHVEMWWPFAVDQYSGQVGVSLFGVCYRNTFLASRNRSLEPRLSTLAPLR